MSVRRMLVLGMMVCALVVTGAVQPASAVNVELELLLLADVSGSVDDTDFALQRDGYVAAFQDAGVISAIQSVGSIAVPLVYWSTSQAVAVPWQVISDAASSQAFAAAIAAAPRPFSDRTGMVDAMNYGANLFAQNGIDSVRQTIDVSGDGSETVAWDWTDPDCPPLQAARDNALNNLGVDTINALWIRDPGIFGYGGDTVDALAYGQQNVIGGDNAFQTMVDGFDDFAPAVREKIYREITQPSVPDGGATVFLLGLALSGIAAVRRKIAA